ncbi:spartin-like [Cololabis saira]|uniref:spartin-like n=1 Tax=Cololabis saira TaxID=129043 RepID=UPI002AD1D786|nr:spartin-like [Cololabis saira]
MTEPAELLLIRDQYELAFHSLGLGLVAEEADNRAEAVACYRKAQLHLTQGLDVPAGGDRHQGPAWDTARLLQQKMRDTLGTLSAHLSEPDQPQLTTGDHRNLLLKDLPPNLYPDLATDSQPSHSSVHHLYPTIPATQNATPTPGAAPVLLSPASPAAADAAHTDTVPAAALGSAAMENSGEQPPAYTPKPTDGHRSLGLFSVQPSLGSGKQSEVTGGNGNELLSIPFGVQLFFVEPNGQVSSLSYPGYLRIITLDREHKDSAAGKPSAFLHVCDRLYPLTSDTPVLLANSGIFMFPDSLAEIPGSYVGIVLSSELPSADREMFQDLLSQLAELRIQGPEGTEAEVMNLSSKVPLGPLHEKTGLTAPGAEKDKLPLPGWSEKMAQGILSGATRLSESLAKGAEVTGKVIHKGAAKIRDHITPEDTPSEVSPRVSKGLNVAKKATGGAVRVSQFLVNGVSTIAEQVADKVAPRVKKHGAKLIPESMKKTQEGRASNLDGAKFVAASGVQGFSTVWSSLESGAKNVCKGVATETVQTVKYKYGDDASQATDTALKSVANVGLTAHNIDNLGIKAFLKTAGKKTAKAFFRGHNGQRTESEGTDVQKEEQHEQAEENKEQEHTEKKEVEKKE